MTANHPGTAPVEATEKFRPIDLGVSEPSSSSTPSTSLDLETVQAKPTGSARDPIDETHVLWRDVAAAITDGYGGAILSGPPGTGKSWYAQRIAARLAKEQARIRTVQFHPGYQYEDFVEGWEPGDEGTFKRVSKHLLLFSQLAANEPNQQFVMVIDEISRADVPRVFGEALTYLEMSLRNKPFFLASGRKTSIPKNLFIIATMNPWDVSVDELDVALERRFAHIEVLPSVSELVGILENNQAPQAVQETATRFFEILQKSSNSMLHLGHAYFNRVSDEASLDRLWRFQIWPHIRRVTRLDPTEADKIKRSWNALRAGSGDEERTPAPIEVAAAQGIAAENPASSGAAGVPSP